MPIAGNIALVIEIVAAVVLLIWIRNKLLTHAVVYEFQRGLLYRNGKLERVLEPGRYSLFRPWHALTVVDVRSTIANVTNQEIVCADNLALRFSSTALYKVADPVKATHGTRSYSEALHLVMQLVMRDLVSGMKVEDVLNNRNDLSTRFTEEIKARSAEIGLAIENAGIRDVTFPADVKRIFSQVANAEKAAQASLARSRSEVASLRALANAARMIDENPNLLTLRTLQSVTDLANTSGNTIVVGLPSALVPMPNGKERVIKEMPPAID